MPTPVPTTATNQQQSLNTNAYLLPFILVTSLFFLWGLATILNSALIAQFQPVFEINRAQALLVETAFYLGYFTIAIPAGLFMERFSYKKGILFGLLLYATGGLLFIPAAKFLTFGFFLVALYIIASGLAFLETGANPYVMLLGRSETSTVRLNFAQSFNGIALVLGPIIAGKFIFSGNEGALDTLAAKQQAADAVIVPYAIIACAVLLVAVLFFFVRMPEPDKGQKLRFNASIFKVKHLMLGVVAQFLYVGAQAGLWGITIDYVTELLPGTSKEVASSYYLVGGTMLFVVGRFLGTWVMSFIKDHTLLSLYAGLAATLCAISLLSEGVVAVYALLGINFFLSIMFPTIFALGVKGLGDYTKIGSSLIIMAIAGGAILPPIMGMIAVHYNIQLSLIIPCFAFLYIFFYGWRGYRTVN